MGGSVFREEFNAAPQQDCTFGTENEDTQVKKEPVFMEQYAEQDKLIQEGVSMICTKLIDSLEMLLADNHDSKKQS